MHRVSLVYKSSHRELQKQGTPLKKCLGILGDNTGQWCDWKRTDDDDVLWKDQCRLCAIGSCSSRIVLFCIFSRAHIFI